MLVAMMLLFGCVGLGSLFAQGQPTLDWSKFDFVPGDEIIFDDNQEGERNGEFPRRWDLTNGSVENAVLDGENVIFF